MIAILVTGTLAADPQRRQAANGNPFATALLRVPTGEESALVSVIVFDPQACEDLLRLKKGDSVSITGRAKLTAWTGRDGETRHGLSVVAEQVMSAYQVGRKRKQENPGRRTDFGKLPGWAIPDEAGDLENL